MSTHDKRFTGVWLLPLLALAGVGAAGRAAAPVAQAVKDGDQVALAKLLDQRADVNSPLADGTTALHWAVYRNDPKTADRLVRAGANVNAANRYGATPLWMAASDGNAELVELLLKAGASPNTLAVGGEPVLMAATRAGSVEAVQALLARGSDANAKEARHDQTALMSAVGGRDPHPEIAEALLERGAKIDVRSDGGFTPFLFAVRQGDLTSIALLVKAGADVNDRATLPGGKPIAIIGSSNWTMPSADTSPALSIAIDNSHYEVALFLLEHGANPNAAPSPFPFRTRPSVAVSGEAFKPGFAPLHAIVHRRARGKNRSDDERSLAVLKALLAHGADPNTRTPAVQAPVPLQPSPQPEITQVEVGGVTPLWVAANSGDIEAMRVLIENGADPRLTSMEDTTPLMVAAGLGHRTRGPSGGIGRRASFGTEGVEVVKLLLESGNDINAVNAHGQTALHGAAFAAAPAVIQFLLAHGARTDLKDAIGRRPLEVADDNRRDEYRPTLQNYNPDDVVKTWEILRDASRD